VYLEIPIGSVDPDALAVTASGVAPLLGFNVKAATGAPTATGFVALPVAPLVSVTVTWAVKLPPAEYV
jgi:hypothetical protein